METLLIVLFLAMLLLVYVTLQNMLIREQQKAVYEFVLMLWENMPTNADMKPPAQPATESRASSRILTLLAVLMLLCWLLPYTY